MRKSISKKIRQQVYDKYNGRCAYCGCQLEYKDMQVDHMDPVYRSEYYGEETDNSIDNYMPSCRACNFYKGVYPLEQFRDNIQHSLIKKLRRSNIKEITNVVENVHAGQITSVFNIIDVTGILPD